MGFLRLWLALLVVASHTRLASLHYGIFAVECFFAISGFYMQMILSNYLRQPQGIRKFYASRALRIYAPYWTILTAVLLIGWITGNPKATGFFNRGNVEETLLSLWLNLFIVGTEHIKLLRLLGDGDFYLWRTILIAPVWSVGIELIFYLLAPFLLRKFWILALVTFFSLAAKAIFLSGYDSDLFLLPAWDGVLNGIFPFELGIFGIGALAYRCYEAYEKRMVKWNRRLIYAGAVALILLISLGLARIFHLRYDLMVTGWYGVIFMLAISLPVLFAASRNRKWDRRIGDLSYATYLWHLPLYATVKHLGISGTAAGLATCALSVLLAIPVVRWVEQPLERFRHRRFRQET